MRERRAAGFRVRCTSLSADPRNRHSHIGMCVQMLALKSGFMGQNFKNKLTSLKIMFMCQQSFRTSWSVIN